MIRYVTSGESHGKCLTAILEGIPSGLELDENFVNIELARRQRGFGRGERMRSIESDKVSITSGVRHGKTIGSPITLTITNKDWENWKTIMSIEPTDYDGKLRLTRPRPGHADLPGLLKYNTNDTRDILERASARETAARVAIGAVCKKLLQEFNTTNTERKKAIVSFKVLYYDTLAMQENALPHKQFADYKDKAFFDEINFITNIGRLFE